MTFEDLQKCLTMTTLTTEIWILHLPTLLCLFAAFTGNGTTTTTLFLLFGYTPRAAPAQTPPSDTSAHAIGDFAPMAHTTGLSRGFAAFDDNCF